MENQISSFLGANTPRGFVSFFDELYNPYNDEDAFIIKGGPGTGKSTLMKKIAQRCDRDGIPCERVYCSSDPKSLDGIIVPSLGFCAADGTSPHVIEPRFPGASENIINLGDFWDKALLRKNRDKIKSLTLENSLCHRRSTGYLAAAGALLEENRRLTHRHINTDKLHSFALRFVMRELPKKSGPMPGKRKRRFISGITPEGPRFLEGTVNTLCHRKIAIEDEYTDCSSLLCSMIGDFAVKNGYDVVLCHCPMKPDSDCEHIIIPEKGLCIMTVRSAHKTKLQFDRVIHARRFLREGYRDCLPMLRLNRRLSRELIKESTDALKRAKGVHDELEKLYCEAMDFSALDNYCEKICDFAFGCK